MSEEFSINEIIYLDRDGNNLKDKSDAPSNILKENSVNEVIFMGMTGSKSKDKTAERYEQMTNDGSGADENIKNSHSVCQEI